MVDPGAVRAFLEPSHLDLAGRVGAWCRAELVERPEPPDDDAARGEAKALVRLMGHAGWYAPIRERDARGACVVREALAWASPLADAVWALQGLGTTPLLLHGTAAQKERWLDAAGAGRCMTAFAMTEEGAGSDVAALSTRAEADAEGYVISGEKTLISNAGIADLYVVFASTDPGAGSRGLTAFLVPADTPGLRFVEPQVMDAAHPLGRLALDACRLPAGARLGEEGQGFKVGMATLDRLRPTVGAAACGMAARALDEALAHATTRHQFGRPLSDFQLVQEKLGRMAVELDAARLLVYRAAWEADGGAERITVEAAMAKAHATETAQKVVDEAVQILGGRGVLRDHPVDRLYRSVRALRIYEGTTEIQRLIVARALIAKEGR
ncbi:MAG: acyl-CoA dehydrogenase family protein [Gemmatimonadetes bacterium]|nr:acyl-CoA dehydrogenase family protein [Gemmatimonadota bacterium]